MKELLLTDNQAYDLIKILKTIALKHNVTLTENSRGQINLVGCQDTRFILNYFYSENSKVFNFRETEHNYTLFRINLNNKFHKNADGTKISGNRINIFSVQEYLDKGDEVTHYKAYQLPYDSISDSDDFLQVLSELFQFTNTNNPEDASVNIQQGLL